MTLGVALAQAQPYWQTNGWPNDNAPFGTNGNVINNWSFEAPPNTDIGTGWDTIPYWFSSPHQTFSSTSGMDSTGGEAPPDGLGTCWETCSDLCHVRQTTSHIIQQGDCFLFGMWVKNEWAYTAGWGHTDGYITVVLYYGGTTNVVAGDVNTSIGTVGTPFFTNTFVIHPAANPSHTEIMDWTNYFFGVITDWIPTNAIGQTIGIDFWDSTTNFNPNDDPYQTWLNFDGVILIPTNGIAPIASPLVLTPTNSVWGGDTLTFSENCFGSLPIHYQWQTDGGGGGALTNIDVAGTNFLTVVTSTNAGTYSYQVIVTNSYGSVTSAVVSYVVLGLQAPSITQDTGTAEFGAITNLFAFIGGNVNLYAAFTGAPVVTNQWLLKLDSGGGYTNIAGATGWYWTVANVQSLSAGNYMMGATNAFGSINSTPAHLMPLADPAAPASNGVTNMYSNCVMTNHPWAYWKFEETNDTLTSSMQAYDYSGHNYDATYGNSDGTPGSGCKDGGESVPQYGPNGTYAGFTSTNMCATLSYNHNNGYLRVPPLNLKTNTVTFTMWIYPNRRRSRPAPGRS